MGLVHLVGFILLSIRILACTRMTMMGDKCGPEFERRSFGAQGPAPGSAFSSGLLRGYWGFVASLVYFIRIVVSKLQFCLYIVVLKLH